MPSSIKEIENTTYESVRGTPFTKIHGRPSRNDYEILKKEASDLACELDNITYDWSHSAAGDEYGLAWHDDVDGNYVDDENEDEDNDDNNVDGE